MAKSRVHVFLKCIEQCPSISIAAKAAGIHRATHHRRYKTDADYAKAFDEAYEIGWSSFEDVCIRDAQFGIAEPIVYKGEIMLDPKTKKPVLVYKVPERLRMMILRGRKRSSYATETHEHTGAGGQGPIEVIVRSVLDPKPE